MAQKHTCFVVEALVIICLGTMLCSGLPSSTVPLKLVNQGSVEDLFSSWPEHVRLEPKSREMAYDGIRPPKHIMKVMKHLSQDDDLLKGRGNTVRSYSPHLEFTCNEPTYVFSVRPHNSEDLQSVELHYFSSKRSNVIGSDLVISVQLHLIQRPPSTCQLIAVQHRPLSGRGWQTIDITSYVVQLMNTTSSSTSKITIGVSFRVLAGSHDTPRERNMLDRMISNHARPFLLMYAQGDVNKQNNSVSPWAEKGDIAWSRPTGKPGLRRHVRSINANPVITNEFPHGENTNLAHQATFQHFTEQDSKRRKSKKRTSKKRKGYSKKRGKAPLLDQVSSTPDEENPVVTNKDPDLNTVLPDDPSNGVCSRHAMFVDFNTINWDRYVIAPTGFDAFYCAGDCSFPLSKTANPSNHAAIQSVMSVVGAQADIPLPCCVPQSLSSLSILFFDEDSNVALKTYQNMVVESCGCR